ncbi:hypothetical protein M0R45_010241 [Rubus argutus]|uniref:Uncharacterized protein n=1 Tax=Rubus argutus TaxID=59490 RepID=A0AAW1Y8W2_RUBAR
MSTGRYLNEAHGYRGYRHEAFCSWVQGYRHEASTVMRFFAHGYEGYRHEAHGYLNEAHGYRGYRHEAFWLSAIANVLNS